MVSLLVVEVCDQHLAKVVVRHRLVVLPEFERHEEARDAAAYLDPGVPGVVAVHVGVACRAVQDVDVGPLQSLQLLLPTLQTQDNPVTGSPQHPARATRLHCEP